MEYATKSFLPPRTGFTRVGYRSRWSSAGSVFAYQPMPEIDERQLTLWKLRTTAMRTFIALVIAALAFSLSRAAEPVINTPPATADAQPGVGERVGESVDRGLSRLGEKLRRGWADIRRSVDELTVQGRVYGRLRWDKALANAPIEIGVQNEKIVTLTGAVPDESARHTAVTLAENTVGVGKVIDHLTISTTTAPPPVTLPPGNSAPGTDRK